MNGSSLSNFFGPFVPLFIPWVEKFVLRNQSESKNVSDQHYLFSYVGHLEHAPRWMREIMDRTLMNKINTSSSQESHQEETLSIHYGPDLRDVITIWFQEGGEGRRIMWWKPCRWVWFQSNSTRNKSWIQHEKILLDGSDPLVYYASLIEQFPDLIEDLVQLSLDDVTRKEQKEQRIMSLYHSHFLPKSVLRQIEAWLIGGPTDLVRRLLTAARDQSYQSYNGCSMETTTAWTAFNM